MRETTTAVLISLVALAAAWGFMMLAVPRQAPADIGYSCYTFDQWAFNSCTDGDHDRRWSI